MRNFHPRSHRLMTFAALVGVMILSTCSVNQVGLGAKVDITPPKIAFTSPSSGGQYFRGALTVTGTTSDDLASNVSVTLTYQTQAGGTAAQTISATQASQAGGTTWTFTVPSGTNTGTDIKEGSSTITASASDDSGKTSSVDINVIVDNKNPTILVNVPSSYGTTPAYSTSSYLEVKGEVYDPSPITRVEVSLTEADGTPIPQKDGTNWKTANGSNSWNTRITYISTANPTGDVDLSTLENTTLFYQVRATDAAGNQAISYYHVQDFSPFLTTGALFPATDEIGAYDQGGTTLTIGGSSFTGNRHDGQAGRPFGDFVFDSSTSRPVVTFTNLNPQASGVSANVLGFNASIRGSVGRGLALGAPAVDSSSISVSVAPLSNLTGGVAMPVTVQSSNGSYTFQADIKDSGGVFYSNGYYRATIHAQAGTQTTDQTVDFMINTKAPWVVSDLSVAPTNYFGTYLSPTSGFKLRHTDATTNAELSTFEVNVPVWDQNGADKVEAVTARAYIIDAASNKTEITSANSNGGGSVVVAAPTGGTNLWKVTVPFPANTALLVSTSQIQVDLVLTNDAGLNGYLTILYNIRSGDPVVSNLTPAPGTWVTGTFLTFSGNASVENSVQVRSTVVAAGTYANAEAAKAAAGTWPAANGVVSWSAAHDMSGLPEGTYDFWAVARDSDGTYGTPLTTQVKYDKSAPVLVETTSLISGTSLVVRNQAVAFGGSVTDPNLKSVSVTYQKDGGLVTTDLNDTSKAPTWAWTLAAPADHSADGIYDITFQAEDESGKSASFTRRVQIDTTSPFLSITAPVADELVSTGTYTIRGQVTDNGGKGITSLEYSQDSTDGTNGFWTSIALTGLNWTVSGVNFSASGEGTKNLWVRASDGLNPVSLANVSFFYDTADPVLSVDGVSTQVTKNGNFVLSGLASDTNALTKVEVFATKDGLAQTPSPLYSTNIGSWTLNKSVNTTTHGDDGLWVFTIIATDAAGRTKSMTRTVLVDTTAGTAAVTSPAADGTLISSSTFFFSGTAADTGGSGVSLVQYAIAYTNDGNDANDTWVNAAGTSSWSFIVNDMAATFGSEGGKVLGLRTTDNAGNVSTPVTRSFIYDTAAPVVAITSPATATQDSKVGFALAGTATDNYGISSVAITQKKDGGAAIPITISGPSGTSSWTLGTTVLLPRDPSSIGTHLLADGTYTYAVTATDLAGKPSLIASVTVRIDQTAPNVLTVIDPAVGQTGTNSLTGKTNVIRGTVSDAGVGTGKIWYAITASATPPAIAAYPTDPAGYTALTSGNGNWSFTDSNRAEGQYYLHVLAEDTAGNRSAAAVTRAFDIDVAAPVLSESTIGNAVLNTKVGYSIAGTWTETHGVASFTVTQSKDGGTAVPITTSFTSTSPWSLTGLPRDPANQALTLENDGLYDYQFTITDLAGKTTSLLRSVRLDKTGPTVSILNPSDDSSWSSTSSYTISGAATDLTAVRAIYYAKAASAPAIPANPNLDANWVAEGWTKTPGTNSWSVGLTSLAQGANQSLWISAVDTAGNTSTPEVRTFGVDTAKPTLSASTPPANTNAGFSITGTAADTVGVASVTVTQTKNGGSVVEITSNPPSTSDSWATWSLTNLPRNPASIGAQATLDATANGVYDYSIVVTDLAGKTETVNRTVRFDATASSVTITGPGSDGSIVGSSAFSFSGIASDGSDSGVALVEYSLDSGSTWPDAVGTNSWSFNIADMTAAFGSEGAKSFLVRATDNAGNVSTPVTRSFVYDTAVPLASITGAATRDSKIAFTLAGSASDAYGIASITITQAKDGGTAVPVASSPALLGGTVTSRTWTLGTDVSLPRDPADIGTHLLADGDYLYRVTATDLAGKASTVALVTVRIDQTAPNVLTVIDPAVGQTGTNSLTGKTNVIRGTVSDAGVGTGKIWYAITASASAPVVSTTPAAAGYSEYLTGNGNWSFTDSNRAEGQYYLHLLAEDTAENLTAAAVTRAFDIDVAAPVLAETTIGNSVFNTKLGYSISGTWTETHGVASFTVTQSKDGGAAVPITTSFTSTSPWSLTGLPRNPADESATLLADGLYEYLFTITDLAGKTTTLTRTVRFDATGPTTAILNPSDDSSWASTTTYSFSGSATDLTSVKSIWYQTGSTEPALPGDITADANWTGAGWTKATGTNSWTIALTGLAQGANQRLWVRSLDTANNLSSALSRTFGVDTAKPTLSASTPPANTNAGFSITGTAADTVGVASVTVTQTKNGGSVVEITSNPPSTSDSWATWSLTNLPRNPASIGAQATLDATADGVYDYSIVVTDLAGRTETLTRSVRFDKTPGVPTISNPLNDSDPVNSSSFSFAGSASDTGGSGIGLVQYATTYSNDANDANDTWVSAAGTNSWSFVIANLTTTFGGEGGKLFGVRTVDNAGNTSASVARTFIYDTAAPVAVISGAATRDTKVAFTLAGTATDSYGIATISVTQSKDGGAAVPVTISGPTGTTAWTLGESVSLPRNPASIGTHLLADGSYTYDVIATDLAGKTSTLASVTVRVDQSAPNVLTVIDPASGQTGLNSLTGKTNIFRGTAADAGVGMAKIWYLIDTSASASPGTAGYTEVASGANWSFTDSNRAEGSYYLHVKAEDSAGNLTPDGSAVTRAFDIDVAAPVLAETTIGNSVFNTKLGYSISGSWTESQGVASFTVTQKKDGGAAVPLTTNFTTASTWSLTGLPRNPADESATLLADGLYEYLFTITDLAGKSASITRTIRFDATAPVLTITSPSEGSWSNTASVTITGVTTDGSGSGITAVQYSSDGTNYSAVGGSLSSWNVPLTGLSQGAKVYYFRATDATANVSTPLVLNFGVDTAAPSVPTETTSPALTLSKVGFAFGGALADTNALVNLTVTQNKDSAGAVELVNTAKSGTADTWTLTGLPRDPAIPANTLLADGSYEYVITVTDAAGKTASLTRTVRIDTTGPSATIDNPGLYLSGNAGSLFGLADDGTGSGIDKVQYSLTSATGPWTDATGKNNWLVSLNLDTDGAGTDTGLAEGPYTLYVQALDKAGNATTVAASQAFEVDQAAPSLTLYKVDAADFTADTIYGNTTLALSGTALDSYGVQSVAVTQFKTGGTTDTLTVNLNAGTTSRTWTASADLGQGEGTYTITVTITDLVGRQTNIQKTVIKDTQAPGLPTVTTPASANQWLSGATFNFGGTAADVGTAGVAVIYYGFGAQGLTPTTDLGDPFWTQASGTTSWSASVDLTGEGTRSLYLKAVDRAGNISALQTFNYGIDQSNPSLSYLLPSGSFINGNLTLSGTASDTNAVNTVSVSEKKPGDISFNYLGNANYNSGDGTWSYLHLLSAFDGLVDGVYEYRIIVTDVAGKTTSFDKSITQDFLNPVVTLNAPTPTIGGPVTYQGNGTLSLGGTISDLNGLDALEIRVGAGAWTPLGTAPFTSFTSNLDTTALTDDADVTVTIRATDKAGNQGTSTYAIHVDQDTDKPVVVITGPAAAENVQSANISMTGTISDDEGVDTSAVQYRISYNGGTDWTAWTALPAGNISGAPTSKSFTYTLNDPSNGSKILQIRAADTGAVVGDAASVTFTQDTGAPVLSSMTPAEGTVTNAASFVVAGTATDSASVQSVTYRVLRDGVEIVAAAATTLGSDTDAGAGEIRTFTSPAISTASGTGNYQIQLISSDGTNTRQETINIIVDKTAPTVTFSSPSASSIQNNIITLTGTASDNRLLASVGVEIWKGGSKVADAPGTVLGTSNWSLSFNTADFDDNTNATFVSGTAYDITLRATASDSIGNVGSSSDLTFRIDQATDSPVIAVSTAQSPTYLSAFTVNGTADDDDGISLIEVSANGSVWTTVTAPGGGWTKNSSWNTALAAGDGTKTLYVRVTDSSTPGIVTTSSVYNFRVDQESPDGAFTSPAVNTKLKTGEFAFTGTFADESGVSNVQLKVDSGDFGTGDVKTAVFTPGTSGTWNYTFLPADFADGVRTIYLQITDAAGKTSSITRAVTIDMTAPVVTVTEPANASSAFGLVRLRGSAVDATSGVRSVKIGLGKTINTADWDGVGNTWYTATGTVSWEYVITNINNYANTTFATDLGDTNGDGIVDGGETWQGIWRIYLYVRSEDTAGLGAVGNVSVVDTFYLEVDPLRDRPEITVLQPVDATSTVGGFLRIVGSAYDTNFIAKNQIAFDLDNNGVFSDAGDVWPAVAPAVDQTDANTTAWYAMTGTTSWSTVINNSGEFNPTGGDTTKTIKFKVRSVDSKVAHGGTPSLAGLEAVYTVTFSNQVPQYSNINLATGDTIGGTVVLTGFVKVPSAVGMDSIRFNHDGPRLSSTELLGGPAGMRAVLLLSGDPNYEATYDKYAVEATINTNDADLFPNNAGSMTVSLRAYDNSAFQSFQTISLTVDNKAPTAPSFTNLTEIAGTAALLQGSATDTGVVSGIQRVVFYLEKAGNVYRLKGGSGSLTNAASQVLDLTNAAYDDYRIVVDKTTEGGNDAGAGGDLDGFNESLSSSFGVYTWNATFNSTLIADGRYDAKFTAYDVGENSTTYTQSTFVANNKPVITSIVLATDLNGNGNVTDSGEASSNISSNYATTGYTGRGNLLGITVNTTGGNGTKRYSVLYGAVERNSVLTANSLVIDTSGIADSTVANDRVFTILVYDSTTSDDVNATDELSSTITVGVTIDNVDEIKPSTTLIQLTKDDVKTVSGVKYGRVQPWTSSPFNNLDAGFGKTNEAFGNDADVSGTILLRGTATDNQRIKTLSLWLDLNGDNVVDAGEQQVVADENPVDGMLKAAANTLGTWTATTQTLSEAGGHSVTWSFEWNTVAVSGTARANVRVAASANDYRSTPNVSDQSPIAPVDSTALGTGFNLIKLDVVPFISKIGTSLGLTTPLNPSIFNRTALGRYPVYRKVSGTAAYESITVEGFNLNPSVTNPVVVSKDADGVNATFDGVAAGALTVANARVTQVTANEKYTVSLQDVTSSGHLNFITLSGGVYIPTLNGIDDNTQSNNTEGNGVNNDLLNDDRYLDIWDINQLNFGDVRNVDMELSGNTINWGLSYVDDRAGVSVNGAAPTLLRQAYTRYFDNKLAYNASGSYFFVAQSADSLGVPVNAWNLPSHFGLSYRSAPGQAWEYTASTNTRKMYLESNWNGSDLNKLDRVQWPDIKVTGTDATSYVYLTYYDAVQKLVKFRYNQIGTAALPAGFTGTTIDTAVNTMQTPYGNGAGTIQWASTEQAMTRYTSGSTWQQGFTAIAGGNNNSPYSAVAATSTGTVAVFWYDAVNNQLKMKYNTAPATAFSGYQAFVNGTVPAAGTYTFKLTVDGVAQNGGNDITVILGNSTNGSRKYELAYQLNKVLSENYGAFAEVNPISTFVTVRSMQTGAGSSILLAAPTAGTSLLSLMGGVSAAVPGTGAAWVERVLDTDSSGKYVSAAVDANDAFHVAYQKTSTGDLRYLRLDTAGQASLPTPITVDSYLQVGQYIDITTRSEDVNADAVNEIIPYISYFNISNADTKLSAKLARLVVVPASLADGVDAFDKYTGTWEVSTLPAREIPKQYRINVGVTTANDLIVGYAGDQQEYQTYKP